MDVNSVTQSFRELNQAESKQEKKEEVAMQFEKIFARQLVSEITKDSFKMGDKNGVMGKTNSMYRRHIVDTLATEIAKQRKLGMADLIKEYKKV